MSPGPSRLTSSLVCLPSRASPRIAVAVAIAIAERLWALRGFEQLAGVPVGRLVALAAAQHPDDLGDQLVAVDPLDRRRRRPALGALLDPEMALRHGRDLRKVGDAEHLPVLAQRAQPLPHRLRGLSAHPPL